MRSLYFWIFLSWASPGLFSKEKEDKYDLNKLEFIGFNAEGKEERRGLESILRGDEYFYGIPEKIFKINFSRFSQKKLWELGNIPSPSSKNEKLYLSDFRRDVGKFKKLPLGLSSFERNGERIVNTNCFSCHAGVVAGKVIAGLPSTNFDPHNQIIQTDKLLPMYQKDSKNLKKFFHNTLRKILLNKQQDEHLSGFMDYFEHIIKPASKNTILRGDNSGPWVVWHTIAKLSDPPNGLEISDVTKKTELEKKLLSNTIFPQITPSPWWNLKYKKRSFWLSDVTHLSPTTFSLNLLDHHEENKNQAQQRMDRTKTHLDYARSIKSPTYPFPINEERAQRGYQVFHSNGRCFKCHGIYSEDGELKEEDFPNKEQVDMGTDPEYSNVLQSLRPLYQQADLVFSSYKNKGYYASGENFIARIPEAPGYSPPPLKGIWASAPYFHNGSVPTLAGVLDAAKRPLIWQIEIDPFSYNQNDVGLIYKEISSKNYLKLKKKHKQNSLKRKHLSFRRIYNTQEYGRSNQGHNVGDKLTEKEKIDLLEYLKKL